MTSLIVDVVMADPQFNSDGIVAWGVKNINPII